MRVQHNIIPISTRGRGSRGGAKNEDGNGKGSKSKVVEDGDEIMGEDSVDAVGDELLELAEGDSGQSIADIENSLVSQGPRSSAFTYDNLFGPGAKLLDSFAVGSDYTDAELGIIRDNLPTPGPLLGETQVDQIAVKKEDDEMAKVLEQGRLLWIERERERVKGLEGELEIVAAKRSAADYDSDEIGNETQSSAGPNKRKAKSTVKNHARSQEQANEGAKLKKLYLIEKAKLKFVQGENDRMRMDLIELREMEQEEKVNKRQLLEKALEAELGRDVSAIFSPPPSPTTQGPS